MPGLNLDEIEYEEIRVTLNGKDYRVVEITPAIEIELKRTDDIIVYTKPGVLEACREQVGILLNISGKQLSGLSAMKIRAAREFIFENLAAGKKKDLKKSG